MITALLLVIIYISFISLGLPDSLLGAAWPAMYGDLAVPASHAGIISMLIAGGTVLSSVMSARIINRFGTAMVTAVSVLMTATALLLFSVLGVFWGVCLAAIPLGLGAGAVDAGLNNYVAVHYKARHMSWLHCFWGLGASAGPMIMSHRLAGTGGWSSGYLTVSIIQFALTAVLFASLPLWNKNGVATAMTGATPKKPLGFAKLLRLPGARAALLSFFCYCSIESAAGLWGGSYLVLVKGIDSVTAARWVAIYYAGITFGRLVSGFLTIGFDHRQMLRLGHSLIAVGIILMFFDAWVPLAGFFLIGLGCAPIFPTLIHETPANFGYANSQAMMGLQVASGYVGTALMPPLFGLLGAYAGYALLPIFLGTLWILMLIMVEILNMRAAKKA